MSTSADNELKSLLDELQHPVVRDLAWACFAPPLMLCEALTAPGQHIANCGLSLDSERQTWLERLDQQPTVLLEHLAQNRSRRLGLYFEALWHFFLQQDSRTELLAHNLPVRDGSRTIGEFDCLYYCRERQRHYHLELAVKFYLGLPLKQSPPRETTTPSPMNRWLGPGTEDRLDRKIERLLDHQLQLSLHPSAIGPLQDLGIGELDLEMEVKGRLFIPQKQSLSPPGGYNTAAPLHNWVSVGVIGEFHEGRYAVLDKHHWLAPVTPASNIALLTMNDLRRLHLESLQRPQLVAAVDEYGLEVQRFFITPEHWPGAC